MGKCERVYTNINRINLQLIDSSHLYSISKYFHSKNYLIFCIPQGSNDV